MLYAKILRSPVAHARIKKIDVEKANDLPGVSCVITYKDAPRVLFNGSGTPIVKDLFKDEYILDDKVRFMGDKVAAVAAVDNDTAEEALKLIEIEYEELPAIFDPEKAMQPSASKIHRAEHNILAHVKNEWGDIDEGFKEADYVFKGRYETPRQAHCSLEPHACVAHYNRVSGELTAWTTTHAPFVAQRNLSEILDIPINKVRVITTAIGGAFGGKNEVILEPLCALLSKRSSAPVKLVLSRNEEFIGTRTRHPCTVTLKTGVKRDGTITARKIEIILNTGAYSSHGPYVAMAMSSREIGLYKSQNLRFDGYCVYTNTPVSGAFRGYGNPQQTFAVESQLDEIAERLGLDPLELRIKNGIRSGDVNPGTRLKIDSCGLQECMMQGAERVAWRRKRMMARTQSGTKRRGLGMACGLHCSGAYPYKPECSSAIVTVNPDGTARLFVGAVDLGQGSSTILAQIVAEELGIGLNQVSVTSGDTAVVPFDQGVYASRTTYVSGTATLLAAREVKMQILEKASKLLDIDEKYLQVKNEQVTRKGSEEGISISKVISESRYSQKDGTIIIGKASFQPLKNAPYFGAQFAEVEVDTETGQVTILKLVSAQDVGKAINPMLVEGQMEGMMHMSMGYALTEDLVIGENGRVLNPNFTDYKILHASDMPDMESIIVEPGESSGPFGAKGLAEGGLVPTAPAIVNAIFNAVGVRINEIPLTSEKMLKGLRKQKNEYKE